MKTSRDFSILLVEDSLPDRMIAKAYLTEFGFSKVQEADDGKMAFFKVQNAKFDLIITDWKMPNVSGLAFLQQLKKEPRYKKIPVIFFTGVNDKAEVEAAIKLGVTDYLVKPVNKEDFLAKIQKLFPDLEFVRVPRRPNS